MGWQILRAFQGVAWRGCLTEFLCLVLGFVGKSGESGVEWGVVYGDVKKVRVWIILKIIILSELYLIVRFCGGDMHNAKICQKSHVDMGVKKRG